MATFVLYVWMRGSDFACHVTAHDTLQGAKSAAIGFGDDISWHGNIDNGWVGLNDTQYQFEIESDEKAG